MNNELVVDVDRISKRFAGHVAVEDLSLRVPKGAVYGLLGPNGAGKTTSIRMIMDITMPDEGTVKLFGDSLGGRHHSARIGYLPEERGLYKKMKVREVLVFLAESKGVPARLAARKADEWLDRLGLGDWRLRKVEELSKGMQQKVQFIGTMLHEPELLILDEPFSGLDPINQKVLKDTLVQLGRAGTTIIFSTHQMDVAERICDHVCIIARGGKVLDGRLAEVKAQHGSPSIMLGFDNRTDGSRAMGALRDIVAHLDESGLYAELTLQPGVDSQQVLQRIMAQNVRVNRFEIVQPSLHRIFLELAGPGAATPEMRDQARGEEASDA
jgi:ABC-2 type transport system ATP-binding protein